MQQKRGKSKILPVQSNFVLCAFPPMGCVRLSILMLISASLAFKHWQQHSTDPLIYHSWALKRCFPMHRRQSQSITSCLPMCVCILVCGWVWVSVRRCECVGAWWTEQRNNTSYNKLLLLPEDKNDSEGKKRITMVTTFQYLVINLSYWAILQGQEHQIPSLQ